MEKCEELAKKCKFNISTVELDEILECVNKKAKEQLVENMMEIRQLKEAMSQYIRDVDNGSNSDGFIFRHYETFKDLINE